MGQFPEVVPKHLFIQIAEQVEWLDRNVGALESSLEKRPEVFHAVCVNLSVNVLLGVVNGLVDEILVQSPIGKKCIGVDRAASIDVFPNLSALSPTSSPLSSC